MAKFKVLGVEGEEVEVNGNTYGGGVGTVIELTDEEATEALAASKIEPVADDVEDEDEEESEEEEVSADDLEDDE